MINILGLQDLKECSKIGKYGW